METIVLYDNGMSISVDCKTTYCEDCHNKVACKESWERRVLKTKQILKAKRESMG